MARFVEGWNWLYNARLRHYFVEHRSLCGKWGMLGPNSDSVQRPWVADGCKACQRKLDARTAQQRKGEEAR